MLKMKTTAFRSATKELRKVLQDTVQNCESEIHNAGNKILATLHHNHTIFVCGNGGSAATAQHFTAELVGRYLKERGPLRAISLTCDTSALTAIGNDYGFEQVFARQLRGLARKGDLLVALTTSGRSPNILEALDVARELGVVTVVLTSTKGKSLRGHADLVIMIPSTSTPRIQEVHDVIVHVWCEIVDTHHAD